MAADLAMPILVVDDYRTMLRITCYTLRQLGYLDVDEAHGVAAAQAMIRRKAYRLIISDWIMGSLSGLDLLRAVRAMPNGAETRFLIVTGEAKRQRIDEARRAGVDEYLVKPFNAVTLKMKIDQVFDA